MLPHDAQRERILRLLEEEGGVTEASVRRVAELTRRATSGRADAVADLRANPPRAGSARVGFSHT